MRDLLQRAGFRRSLPASLLVSLAGLVRSMNCYYSNLIEGRDGTGDRQARRVVSALLERGVLLSDSTRAPLRLAFPATLASRWVPALFPDRVG